MMELTRKRAGTKTNPYSGEEILDWDNVTQVTLRGFYALAPANGAVIITADRTIKPKGWTLYAEGFIPDIKKEDNLTIQGEEYRVSKLPEEWISPFTERIGGTVIVLELLNE